MRPQARAAAAEAADASEVNPWAVGAVVLGILVALIVVLLIFGAGAVAGGGGGLKLLAATSLALSTRLFALAIFETTAGRWLEQLMLRGTPFQLKVWEALLRIPSGTVITYSDLAAAVALLASDKPRGERALETVIAAWPDTPQSREANSRLGDLRVAANDKAGAVPYYAAALKDWPRIGWAADTTLKLADALFATQRKPQGCAALAEFTRRYAPTAADPQKARAAQLRTTGACAA